jgi:hypothetical protein
MEHPCHSTPSRSVVEERENLTQNYRYKCLPNHSKTMFVDSLTFQSVFGQLRIGKLEGKSWYRVHTGEVRVITKEPFSSSGVFG